MFVKFETVQKIKNSNVKIQSLIFRFSVLVFMSLISLTSVFTQANTLADSGSKFSVQVICPINFSELHEVRIGYLADGTLAFQKIFFNSDKKAELNLISHVTGIKGIETIDLGQVDEKQLELRQVKVDQMLFDWYLDVYDYGRFSTQQLNCQ